MPEGLIPAGHYDKHFQYLFQIVRMVPLARHIPRKGELKNKILRLGNMMREFPFGRFQALSMQFTEPVTEKHATVFRPFGLYHGYGCRKFSGYHSHHPAGNSQLVRVSLFNQPENIIGSAQAGRPVLLPASLALAFDRAPSRITHDLPECFRIVHVFEIEGLIVGGLCLRHSSMMYSRPALLQRFTLPKAYVLPCLLVHRYGTSICRAA